MLKVVNNSTKCAEIYCNALVPPTYNILCICGKYIDEYFSFCEHFYNEHLLKQQDVGNQGDKEEDEDQTLETEVCLEEPLLQLPSSSDCEDDTLTDNQETSSRPERRAYKERNKPNTCSYCGRIFQRRHLLDTHLNIHTGSKPHQCHKCGKQFRAITTLTRHLRTHEKRQEHQQCKHCDKQFTHRSALVSHEMRHTQVRRWACSICDKSFYTRNQMDTHQRKLHAKLAEETADNASGHLPFSCELCGNSYRSASMLSTHKLKKHYRLAKYACEQCDRKFVDAERLQQHQLIHKKPEIVIK
ncbi:zinc finger protein 98-like [Drosophila sulfurigaster albostrigata]|uniref:zinc finger protein 98-like n=1 Tax=Drosophila sulfurigaster albostrigata TaxID=89887 RepID=UPI002D219129|nr:zinc finger protein 98-like [Drosophila sulfurigaster albostrigata]